MAAAASMSTHVWPLAPLPKFPPLGFDAEPPEMDGTMLVETGPWGSMPLDIQVMLAVEAGAVMVPMAPLTTDVRPTATVSVRVTFLAMPEITLVTFRVVVV